MNSDFKIFGKNGEIELFYNFGLKERSDLKIIVEKSKEKSQMTVYRNDTSSICYVYIKRLSNINNFIGICLKFNGSYCTDNKKIFDIFEQAVESEIEQRGKILAVESEGKVNFVTSSFEENKVDIKDLNAFFTAKIGSDLDGDFQDIDGSFLQNKTKQKCVSFQDDPEYIIKNIKEYNFVTITPDEIQENVEVKKWRYWLYPIIISIFIFFMLYCISGWHYINLIPCISMLVLGLGVYFFYKKKKNFSLFILNEGFFSVVGFFLAIAIFFISAVFSQYEIFSNYYDTRNAIKNLYENRHELYWDSLIGKSDTFPNNIIFIVDVSKSVYNTKIQNIEFNSLNDKINNTNWVDHNGKYQCGNFYSDIIKAKLKILLYELNNGSIKGEYSILKFSNGVEELQYHTRKNISKDNLRNSFNKVDSLIFNGNRTDFSNLLSHLDRKYGDQSYNQYGKAKYSFIFLSDYIHDKNSESDNEKIIQSLKKIRDHSIYSNFYIIKPLEEEKQPPNTILISKLINEIPRLNFQFIDDIMNDNFIVSKINRPKPLLLYYSSYLFSKNIETKIKYNFDKMGKQFEISVKYHKEEDNRQIFFIKKGEEEPKILSQEFKPFVLDEKNNTLSVLMEGHIPSQYPFAELIIKDIDKHIDYYFEIVFFKELPQFFRWFIPLFFGFLGLYFILFYYFHMLIKKSK